MRCIDLARRIPPGVWATASFFLLGLTWLWITPPGGSPDEASHYVRMVGLAHGQLIGSDVDRGRPLAHLDAAQLERVNAEAGMFRIPGDLPPPSECNVLDRTQPFTCGQTAQESGTIEAISNHGRYLPGAYVIPAAFSRLGAGMWSTLMLGRLGMLVQCTALFGLIFVAFDVLRERGLHMSTWGWSLVVLTVTPVAMFLVGTLSPSAVEIFSVAAFTVSLLVLARTGSQRWMWTAAGLAWMASWARDLGGPAIVMAAASLAYLEPGMHAWWRTRRRSTWSAVSLAGVGVVAAQAWSLVFKQPFGPDVESVGRVWRDVAGTLVALRDSVGLGGWLNVPLDPVLETAWVLIWLAALAETVRRCSQRGRLVLLGQGAILLVISVLLIASLRAGGFGTQGRFLLPLVVVIVIVAASQAGTSISTEPSVRSNRALRAVMVLAALGHGSLLLLSAQRQARGLNQLPIDFAHTVWSPPGGWAPAFVLGAISCGLIAALPRASLDHPQR